MCSIQFWLDLQLDLNDIVSAFAAMAFVQSETFKSKKEFTHTHTIDILYDDKI